MKTTTLEFTLSNATAVCVVYKIRNDELSIRVDSVIHHPNGLFISDMRNRFSENDNLVV